MNIEELPELFTDQMKHILGNEFKDYADSFHEEHLSGLRINTSKLTKEEFLSRTNFPVTQVPWIPNGFYYGIDIRPAKDPAYYAGLYYLQEPSAMTPACLLPITPGDRVLDLCAAPGGKSTELGVKLQGKGILFANDISNSRAKALLKNLELWGISNICVTSEPPQNLVKAYEGYFDKILVDAPCSGEGMFRKDPDMLKSYGERGPEYFAQIQREILLQAADLLKPGGMLLYSTCTFSLCENEDAVRFLLEQEESMELLELPLFEGACDGIGLHGCIRLFPHKIKGEGHFIALLRKRGDKIPESLPAPSKNTGKLPADFLNFLLKIRRRFDPSRFLYLDGRIYYLPEGFKWRAKLRYLRTGLLMGEIKKERFEPSQALAMTLKPEEFQTVVSWPEADERVIRYLKGETILLKDDEDSVTGWCLICMNSYPLGFAKGAGRTLKNKYYPGWRWQ